MLALLQDTGINYLMVETSEAQEALMLQAGQQGITIAKNASPPEGTQVIAGIFPGIKLSPGGAADTVAAGPTGAPWIDSNGWTLRLAKALRPETNFWVDAKAEGGRLRPKSY